MGIKIGINGFGRIGRVVLRILADDPERFDVCGINLRKADIDYMVYLLKYDSVFRNFPPAWNLTRYPYSFREAMSLWTVTLSGPSLRGGIRIGS